MLSVLLAASSARADDDAVRARGFKAGSMYQVNDIDTINTFNGNLMLSVPVGPEFSTNGSIRYQFRLFYNSNIWDYQDIEGVVASDVIIGPQYGQPRYYRWFDEGFDPKGGNNNQGSEAFPAKFNAGLGWLFSLTGSIDVTHNPNPDFPYHYVSYQTPDGVWHPFTPRLHGDITNIPPDEFLKPVYYTRDGTYLRVTRQANGDYVIDKPDGTRERFVCIRDCTQTNRFPDYVLDQISDPFGNVVHVVRSADGLTETYVESTGVGAYLDHRTATLTTVRQHVVTFEPGGDCVNKRRVQKVTFAGPPGVPAPVYEFGYLDTPLLRSVETFWAENSYLMCPFAANSGEGTKLQVSLLAKVDVPDGRTPSSSRDWTFDYILDPRAPEHAADYPDDVITHTWGPVTWEASYVAGRIYQVTLPTGGFVRYKYERRPFRKVACVPGARLGITALGVRERQVYDRSGTADGAPWRYFRGNVTPGGIFDWCSSNEILSLTVDPLGNATAAFFMAGADQDFGQPFLRAVPDADGTRFLSSQIYQCKVSDFANIKSGVPKVGNDNVEPFGDPKIRRVVARYTEPGAKATCAAPIRSTYVRYENSGRDCNFEVPGDCVVANSRISSDRVIYHDDGGTFTTTSREEFDGLGHYRIEKTGGNLHVTNFPGRPGGDERTTLTNYNAGVVFDGNAFVFPNGYTLDSYPWARINTYDLQVRREGVDGAAGGALGASTLFRFDPNTGFLQRKRTLATTTPCDRDAATRLARCRPAAGEAFLKAHDVLVDYQRTQSAGGETTLVESWYGGDRGALDTSSDDLSVIGGSAEYRHKTVMQYGAVKRTTHLTCGGADFLTTEQNVVDAASGLVTSSADGSGATTAYAYDALFRIHSIDPPGGDPPTTYTYHAATGSQASAVNIAAGDGASGALKTSRVEWDHLGRVALERNDVPNGTGTQASAKSTWYYPNGWKEYESTVGPVAAKPADASGVSFYKYDPFGRVTEIQHPDHVAGSNNDALRRRTLYVYGGVRTVDETIEGIWPASHDETTTWRSYDRFGRLVRVTQPARFDGSDATTIYQYDPQDHLIHVEAPNSQHRYFTYDMRGFLTGEHHPELGPGNWIYHSTFDPKGNAGRLLYSPPSATQRTPFDLTMTYDPAGRLVDVTPLVSRTSGPAEAVQVFKYHPQVNGAVPVSGSSYLLAGKLQSATRRNWLRDPARIADPLNVTVVESFSYDTAAGSATGRANAKTVSAAGNTFAVNYAFDGLGNPTGITAGPLQRTGLPDAGASRTVGFAYRQGVLSSIPGFISAISYHRNATVSSVVHTNGATDTIATDPTGMPRPKRITTTFVSSASFGTGDYAYDARGSITTIGAKTFEYDRVGRLTKAVMPIGTEAFGYDANGNMTAMAGTALPIDLATNRLMTTGNWFARYDVAGNLEEWRDSRRTDVTTKFEWDPLGMLTHVSDVDQGKIHAYSASNERVATFDYRVSPGKVVETWSARGTDNEVLRDFVRTRSIADGSETWAWRDYIRRGRIPVALVRSTPAGNETLRYHVDHLGSVRRMSDAGGNVVDQQDFYAFGEEQQERADANRIKFASHERDDNGSTHAFGDLDSMHARYYGPKVGRFLSIDPGRDVDPANPLSWNLYAYTRNSPLTSIDPNGRESVVIGRMAAVQQYVASHPGSFANPMSAKALASAARGNELRAAAEGMRNIGTFRAAGVTVQNLEAQGIGTVLGQGRLAMAAEIAATNMPPALAETLGTAGVTTLRVAGPAGAVLYVGGLLTDAIASFEPGPTTPELSPANSPCNCHRTNGDAAAMADRREQRRIETKEKSETKPIKLKTMH